VIWTVIPFLILLFMAYPATKTILAMHDTSAPDMTIKVTGYQWKWNYDYLQDGFGFYSNLSTPLAQIENREPKGEHYLLEVDNPLVVPVDTQGPRADHRRRRDPSWWVPAFGVKQDAIPGFVRDSWFRPTRPASIAASARSSAARSTASCRSSSRSSRRTTTPSGSTSRRRSRRRGRRSEQGMGPEGPRRARR
jgi:hypothetical protein